MHQLSVGAARVFGSLDDKREEGHAELAPKIWGAEGGAMGTVAPQITPSAPQIKNWVGNQQIYQPFCFVDGAR
jgi:hypothetical protein